MTNQEAVVSSDNSQETPIKSDSPKRKKKILWIIVALVVSLALLISISFVVTKYIIATNTAKAAVLVSDKVVVATINNQPDKLYELTGKAFRDETKKDDVVTVLKQVSPVLANADFTVVYKSITQEPGRNQMAIVNYKLTTKQGTVYMRVLAEKEADGWKMVNFETQDTPFSTVVQQ